MNNLELEEIPISVAKQMQLSKPVNQRNKRLVFAAAIIGIIFFSFIDFQLDNHLNDQGTVMTTMGSKIDQLQKDNDDLKKLMDDQAKSEKFLTAELNSTKAKLEASNSTLDSTRQDLEDTKTKITSTQSELDETKSSFKSLDTEIQDSRKELEALKADYSSKMDSFTKADQGYSDDIKVMLQKIQSMDIGGINDKIYELQMTIMNLQKKMITPTQTPFVDSAAPGSSLIPSLKEEHITK
jgi:peptidoglycan hydrolase CwlO-like protein